MINNIPYISQWDSEAQASKNDCGPVSLTMVLRGYGEKQKADDVFRLTGAGTGYVSFQQLINAAAKLDYKAEFRQFQNSSNIKQLLDSGICPIVLVQYGQLKSVQDKNFKGPHIMVVTGYREDGWFCHDPNFWNPHREDGKNHFYTTQEFEAAWKATTTDGNTPRCLLVVFPKKPLPISENPPMSSLPTELQKYSLEWKDLAIKRGLDVNGEQFTDYRVIDGIIASKIEPLNKTVNEQKKEMVQLHTMLLTAQEEAEYHAGVSERLTDANNKLSKLLADQKLECDERVRTAKESAGTPVVMPRQAKNPILQSLIQLLFNFDAQLK